VVRDRRTLGSRRRRCRRQSERVRDRRTLGSFGSRRRRQSEWVRDRRTLGSCRSRRRRQSERVETVGPCEAVEAAAGSGAVVGGGVTMAETTLDVTFGAPAELVVGAAGVEEDVAEPAAVELGGGTMAEAVAPATTAEPALFLPCGQRPRPQERSCQPRPDQ